MSGCSSAVDPVRLQRLLGPNGRYGARVELLERCRSTNDAAKALLAAEGDAAHGLLLCAEEQTAGRGRRRADWWTGPSGSNLALSLVVAPSPDPPLAATVAAACSLRAALARFRVEAGIKWPNDLLVGGAKVAGLLLEQIAAADGIVIGLGVNLLAAPPSTVEMEYPTARLADFTSLPIDRTALTALWLRGMEQRLARLGAIGPRPLEEEFLAGLQRWAQHGVAADGEPSGPLVDFALSRGLTWGHNGALATRPAGSIPALHALPASS